MTNDVETPNNLKNNNARRGLTWKRTVIILLVIIAIGGYLLLKVNPPLEVGLIASSEDDSTVVIGIGNTGFTAINVKEVSVNNEDVPAETQLQVSNAAQGLVLQEEDVPSEEEEWYRFANLDEVVLKTGSSMAFQYDEDGNPNEEAVIYGVNISHDESIHKAEITYSHFGITYHEVVNIE